MQKMCRHVRAVAGRLFFIGFSVQIVLGLLWMMCNFRAFFMQLVVAFYAAYRLLCAITNTGKGYRIWGSLALLTFPLAMHCHMLSLPYSLSASCLLIVLAYVTEMLKGKRENNYKEFSCVLCFWLFSGLMQREYLLFGALPVALVCVQGLRKKTACYIVMTALTVGLTLGISSLIPIGQGKNQINQSVSFSLASRFAWSHISEDYAFLPEKVREHLTEQDARQTDISPENMETVLGRTLEDALGEKEAGKAFTEMARGAWQRHKREILHDTVWDALGYTFSPMVLQRQLSGKVYDSYSGRNYDSMRAETPLLTKYYLDYGCWWFAVGLVLAAVLSLCEVMMRLFPGGNQKCVRREKGLNAGTIPTVCMYVFVSGLMIMWYTMRGAGMLDYKNTIAVGILWSLWMVATCIKCLCSLTTDKNGEEKMPEASAGK